MIATHTQATTIPEGQNRPREKLYINTYLIYIHCHNIAVYRPWLDETVENFFSNTLNISDIQQQQQKKNTLAALKKLSSCSHLHQHFPTIHLYIYTLRPRHNCRNFAVKTFKHIFFNENVRISSKISLKSAPSSPVNNIPALVQPTRQQAIIWNNDGIYRHIYTSLSLNELMENEILLTPKYA